MKELEVEETVDIAGRGVAAFFKGKPTDLPVAVVKTVNVIIVKADGTKKEYKGEKEYARNLESETGEIAALLIRDAAVDDVPIGSKIVFENEENV